MLETETQAHEFVASRCSVEAIKKIDTYTSRLIEENERQNLVAKQSLSHIWQRHIADSVQLADYVSRETSPWLDLGSGAGLPGIVIAMIAPDREVIMIESRGLRIGWLRDITKDLDLSNVTVIAGDVKVVQAFPAAVISARAFAPLNKLLALAAPFSTRDTEWVLPKGRSAGHELLNMPKRILQMFHVKQSLTDQTAGILVGKGRVEVQS